MVLAYRADIAPVRLPAQKPDWKDSVRPDVKDEIARQLYIHGSGLQPPPAKKGQIDLSQLRSPVTGKASYDRRQELTGEVKIDGKNMENQLGHLFKSSVYRKELTDSDVTDTGSRLDMIRKFVGAYREVALAHLFKEQPDLAKAWRTQETLLAVKKVQQKR